MAESITVGQKASKIRSYSFEDVVQFSEISGDKNPIHLDEKYASNGIFKRPIVHGILVSGLFSNLIASELPGPGSIYLHQSLDFRAPIYHNQEVKAVVEVISIREDKPIFELSTHCYDEDGKVLIEGIAIVMKK